MLISGIESSSNTEIVMKAVKSEIQFKKNLLSNSGETDNSKIDEFY